MLRWMVAIRKRNDTRDESAVTAGLESAGQDGPLEKAAHRRFIVAQSAWSCRLDANGSPSVLSRAQLENRCSADNY